MKSSVMAVFAISLIGCAAPREPASTIVQSAQACGSGPLVQVSTAAAQEWFGKHRDCAASIDALCKPVRERAAAQWMDSTEGRVCLAARNIAQWARERADDHQTFESGWK
jgi:hypothetical protein